MLNPHAPHLTPSPGTLGWVCLPLSCSGPRFRDTEGGPRSGQAGPVPVTPLVLPGTPAPGLGRVGARRPRRGGIGTGLEGETGLAGRGGGLPRARSPQGARGQCPGCAWQARRAVITGNSLGAHSRHKSAGLQALPTAWAAAPCVQPPLP